MLDGFRTCWEALWVKKMHMSHCLMPAKKAVSNGQQLSDPHPLQSYWPCCPQKIVWDFEEHQTLLGEGTQYKFHIVWTWTQLLSTLIFPFFLFFYRQIFPFLWFVIQINSIQSRPHCHLTFDLKSLILWLTAHQIANARPETGRSI